MARLNEPPLAPGPSAETVDALKRRFLRQNRELAKTNSQQSIRIRNLETEGSRLLAENLSLREQVLQLQNALEAHSNRPSFENIDSLKERLESKIQELGSLVAELGQLKKVDIKPRCRSQLAATRRSPEERQWKSGLGLQEVENAMMPTIVEDKYYPRRTMNADEIRAMIENADTESPDLGPPPVSRFGSEELIAFDPSPPEEHVEEPMEDAEPALAVNLETRRKRRESGPKLSIRRVSVLQTPPDEAEESSNKPLRAGAKRKMSVREDDDKPQNRNDAQAEAFRFSRRNTSAATPDDDSSTKLEAHTRSPERQVLGNKPVNTDPVVSPKKQRSLVTEESDKKPLPASKPTRGRSRIHRSITDPPFPLIQMPEPISTAEINLDSLPPKTPAAEDIISPPSTEPSTSRPESKDTPPPADLSSGDQTGRPSRRARAQVSYKEPSLNTKMRRPGKELVDAVAAHPARRSSVEPTPSSTSAKMFIKGELVESDSWKSLPSGSIREEEAGVGSPLREKLGRRDGSQSVELAAGQEQPKLNSSAASNAISALITGSSIAKRKAPTTSDPGVLTLVKNTVEPAAKSKIVTDSPNSSTDIKATATDELDKNNLAIFDFTESSPNDSAFTSSNRPRIDLAKVAKATRRHSSIPASSTSEGRKLETKTISEGSLSSLHPRNGSVSGSKSSSTSSLGRSTNASTSTAKTSMREKKVGPLPTSSSTTDLKSAAEKSGTSSTGSLRAERAASRRKSMML
ncbi:hypothetical protein CC78DRAFT_566761 [Lojkania enalia]|uniref:Shugoshin n=1 Tax=Lojkania enalia TaxID=147567 RepID=A0A9P4KI48_9PLEO|nr:hypothetical protein CC78DRAFT_566761 [Didymosphaeria enalia]